MGTYVKNSSVVFIMGRKSGRETLDFFEKVARNLKNLIATAVRYLEDLIIEK